MGCETCVDLGPTDVVSLEEGLRKVFLLPLQVRKEEP